MYCVDRNQGRTRVNFISDSQKTKQRKPQMKQKRKETDFNKLVSLQRRFICQGMNLSEYKRYVQEKINNEKYYYKNMSQESIERLYSIYENKLQRKKNALNEMLTKREMNNRQRKLFREKKRNLIFNQKQKMIEALLKELSSLNEIGVSKCIGLSSDPEKWNQTKRMFFLGGRYIENHDKKWIKLYRKIESPISAHLFDLHSHEELNEYTLNY
tara:strand:- start:2653 stop:3291 length:639 start_codon:yes stop_codon:yes gene_type:complete